MKLKLVRETFTPESTIGRLYIDGAYQCFTLEDVCRTGAKIHGRTAIPYGTYKVIITQSARFKRPLPLLVDVPGFAGIRIHAGNTAANTEGCILVGRTKAANFIGESRLAFNSLFDKIQQSLTRGEKVEIEIVKAE